MADLFTVTAPLSLRCPDGLQRVLIKTLPQRDGLIGCEPYWHTSPQTRVHFISGPIKGDGPWKVGDCVVNVLGCHGADPELAGQFSGWQTFLQEGAPGYPAEDEQLQIIQHTLDC